MTATGVSLTVIGLMVLTGTSLFAFLSHGKFQHTVARFGPTIAIASLIASISTLWYTSHNNERIAAAAARSDDLRDRRMASHDRLLVQMNEETLRVFHLANPGTGPKPDPAVLRDAIDRLNRHRRVAYAAIFPNASLPAPLTLAEIAPAEVIVAPAARPSALAPRAESLSRRAEAAVTRAKPGRTDDREADNPNVAAVTPPPIVPAITPPPIVQIVPLPTAVVPTHTSPTVAPTVVEPPPEPVMVPPT